MTSGIELNELGSKKIPINNPMSYELFQGQGWNSSFFLYQICRYRYTVFSCISYA